MSGARPDTWMPIFWGDYARDTGHLNNAMHGAYLMLIKHYWCSGQPLIDDDVVLWRIACCDSPAVWKKLRPILVRFFQVGDGFWRHGRVDAEIARAIERSERRKSAGASGAAKRWQQDSNAIGLPSERGKQNDRQSQPESQSEESLKIFKGFQKVSKAIGPNYEDPATRKAKWEQRIIAELQATRSTVDAAAIVAGYLEGDPKARAEFERVDKIIKARRAA